MSIVECLLWWNKHKSHTKSPLPWSYKGTQLSSDGKCLVVSESPKRCRLTLQQRKVNPGVG